MRRSGMSIRLTDRETDLMHVLWEHGPSTVAEVHARLGKELAYTTVLSVLRTLESKGAVTRTKEGRAHRYAARVPRRLARQRALAALAVRFFRGSTERLLVHLVENERLSDAQILRLRALLDERRRAGR
jgi:BlaI family penicillinase repressor